MKTIALILIDPARGRLGHAAALDAEIVGRSVLQHTLDRAARIEGIDEWVVLDVSDQAKGSGIFSECCKKIPDTFLSLTAERRDTDAWLADSIASARKWSLTAWRGGIGGMSVYDELLPAYPILRAMHRRNADTAVVLRGDWCCMDPELASRQLALFKTAPEALKLTFTQAPPGLSPLVIGKPVVEDLVDHQATIANILCYNPQKPVIDPVGKDVNVPVPALVRDQARRFIHDTPRASEHLREIAEYLGPSFLTADCQQITDASRAIETDRPDRQLARLPQQINIELTPRREATGPIDPQHHIDLGRGEMTRPTLDAALAELGEAGDTAVIFGGLGDALLSEHVDYAVRRAKELGVLGIGIETDLLVEPDRIDRLAALPLDAVSVRINADSAEVYEQLMGIEGGYRRVLDNIQSLYKQRALNRETGEGFTGWIVPRLTKVAENLSDLETFFERWMTICGWAVVDRAWTGMGLIADQSPVPMDPPRRPGKPNVQKHRLHVLSDGTVTLCGQDWLGRAPLGQINDRGLGELWRDAPGLADVVWALAEDERPVCEQCQDWLAAQDCASASV